MRPIFDEMILFLVIHQIKCPTFRFNSKNFSSFWIQEKFPEFEPHIAFDISACGDHIFRQTSIPYKDTFITVTNRTPMLVIVQWWYILYTVRRLWMCLWISFILYIDCGNMIDVKEHHLIFWMLKQKCQTRIPFPSYDPGSAIIMWLMWIYLGIFNTNQSESKWG